MLSKVVVRLPLLALVVLTGAAPAAADDVFTPWHVAALRAAGSATPSPDGGRIAFVVAVPRTPLKAEDGPAWEELHVADVATGSVLPFVTGEVYARQPRWSADGRSIWFIAKRGADKFPSLYRISTSGGEAKRVLSYGAAIRTFDISPDGSRVAFVAEPVDEDREKREALQKKGFTAEVYEETLVNARLFVARPNQDTSKLEPIALEGSVSEVHWSPDGRRLAVVKAPTPFVDDDLMQRRVFVVDASSGKELAALENPGKLAELEWSPDGTAIAIVSGADLNDPAAGRLLVRQVEGGAWKEVLPGYEGHVRDIAWKDATTLVFVGDEGAESRLLQIGRDGRGRQELIPAGRLVLNLVEAPKTGGSLALTASTPKHPAEVFALTPGAQPRRLTDSNPWLASMRFAPQEVVTYKARDGLELQGVLVKPLDHKTGQRVPLILAVHGGPESHDRNGWVTGYADPGQVAAAQGFAVFYPNYRGSTGRGVAFSKLSQGDPAGKEFDDLVDAVDHFVATGLADKAKVGITGGSYGGYATGWAATRFTDRFAAGVMFVGISDKVSKVGTTDIANEEYLVHARKRLWDDWQFFLERSPIYHAAQARTPLLILHGKDDPRVHPSQSLELYRHLKLHGKAPVRLVWYPGEGHGNRKAAARLDFTLRMMRWFRHYLQDGGGKPPAHELEYDPPADFDLETEPRQKTETTSAAFD